ncbi:MAG: GntR family transcriptional regulator [Dehalococcoidia bacterium]
MLPVEAKDKSGSTPSARHDQAYRELRDLIVSGALPPGSPIIESTVADQLGQPRSLVRGALQRLQIEGYVNSVIMKKYSRAVVAPLTAESVNELFTIMGALEGLAARNVTALDTESCQRIAAEMQEVNQALQEASNGSPDQQASAQDLHVRFHEVPVEAAAGTVLFDQIDRIKYQVERYERLYTHVLLSGIQDSVEEHAEIIAALRTQDPDAAQHATEANWRRGAERYQRALATAGPRGTWNHSPPPLNRPGFAGDSNA